MDTDCDSVGQRQPVCQCASKSAVQRWLSGFPIALCLLLSLSSITVCLLMSFKTFLLENRLQMELDKASVFHPAHSAFLNEDGTLIPELSTSVGELIEQVHVISSGCNWHVGTDPCDCLTDAPRACA